MNEELGNVADEGLQRFIEGSKVLCNLIKAEISGNRGEAKAFRTLEYIKSRNYVLKNVELSDGDFRTELDAVVITPSAITIVEVQNKFEGLRTCFSSQLSYKVEGNRSRVIFSDEDMDAIKVCIEKAENNEAYPFEFDVEQYKTDFVTLMTKLEEASVKSTEVEEVVEEPVKTTTAKKVGFGDVVRNIFTSKYARYAGGAAAAFAVSFITAAVTTTTIHKGGF